MRPAQDGAGPDQSNGMCLLDFPSARHLRPMASTLAVFDLPQVATWPGPTSEPGGLSVCTRLPRGVVGPVNASACAVTLPGTSARQKERSLATSKVMGTSSIPMGCGMPQIASKWAVTPAAYLRFDRSADEVSERFLGSLPVA